MQKKKRKYIELCRVLKINCFPLPFICYFTHLIMISEVYLVDYFKNRIGESIAKNVVYVITLKMNINFVFHVLRFQFFIQIFNTLQSPKYLKFQSTENE